MIEPKPLGKRQRAVLEDLFAGELDEEAVLDKYKVSRKLYSRWLTEPAFAEQLDRRVAAAHRRSAVLVASKAPTAAKKLLDLAESGQGETARKACLDIILMKPPAGPADAAIGAETPSERPPLSDETAARLLAVLAEEA
jgi:hypothetical protein